MKLKLSSVSNMSGRASDLFRRVGFLSAALAVRALCAEGETLYNSIELSGSWPPVEVKELDRAVQRVPYLENRPAVINIDIGRQLFVDDFLIDRSTLRREWHYPEKLADNPVLKPESELEINRPGDSCARACCGGVWWDPKMRRFRMWYEAGWLGTAAYAESDDGLSWHRRNLQVRKGTNALFPEGTVRFDSWVVTPDFAAADPYSRWLLFVRPPGGSSKKSYVAESSDGLSWGELKEAGECGDRSTVFYNPFRRKWVFSLRSELGPWARGGARCRSYREADDFIAGSQWKFSLSGSTEDVVMWLQPDELEPRSPRFKLPAQLYNVDAVAYESLMVGAFSVWRGPENEEIVKKGMPKIVDLEFGFSRDGFHFSRADRTAAIASEGWDSGKWDAGYVQSVPNVFVISGEKLLFYYAATAGNTNRLEIGGFSCDLNGCYDQGASGVAVLRRDGFASLRPKVGAVQGEIVTRPLRFSGCRLFVNADVKGGELLTEVLDENGRPVPGFTASESVAFSGDSVKAPISWKGTDDLSPLSGRNVRFRFIVKGAAVNEGDFYSFWVSRSARGESGGYLGGGGPAYKSIRDE
jgi:hypothetical protein